jgi:uncharacterized membrane protein YoaT (DUF817 family)
MKLSELGWIELSKEVIVFSVLTASIVFLWRDNLLLLTVVSLEAAVALIFWHRLHDFCFFLITAFVGTLVEIIFVHSDVWSYANSTFLGIPAWFPPAFGTSALVGQRLVNTVVSMLRGSSSWPAKK